MPSLESNVRSESPHIGVPPDDRPLALTLLAAWSRARMTGDHNQERALLARLQDLARRRPSPCWRWMDTDQGPRTGDGTE